MAYVGLAQADRFGNINAGTFSGKPMGPGGFINTTQSANKVVFCGGFTAGKLETKVEDGKLVIVKEGNQKNSCMMLNKLLSAVSTRTALARKQFI